jgi:hypothetical protein
MTLMTQQPVPSAGEAVGEQGGSPWKAAFASRGFILAVVILGAAALGLNAATEALEVYFKKHPVPLRHRLDEAKAGIPKELGAWVTVQQTSSLDEEMKYTLGTDQFVFRTYVDSRIAGRDVIDRLQSLHQQVETLDEKDPEQKRLKGIRQGEYFGTLRKLQADHPEAVMSLNITYYTGMVDTVAHVPERCMVADGYEPKNPETRQIAAGIYPDGSPREINVQFSTFEDQTGHGRVSRNVAYFFHCNGGYLASPVDVRAKLQNLLERHGYYAKVEMMTDDTARPESRLHKQGGPERSIEAMTDLLTAALPEVERCLPDWKSVKGGDKTTVASK